MKIVFMAESLLDWRDGRSELPTCASIVHNLALQGLWGVSFPACDRVIPETTLVRNLCGIHINYLLNAVSEQVRFALEGKPDSITIWNDKREDRCYDPQLFARQLTDVIQPVKLEKIEVRLLVEPSSDQVKETHRLGIGSIYLHFDPNIDRMLKAAQTAVKLGMSTWVMGVGRWEDARAIRERLPVDGIVIDLPLLRFMWELGSRSALKELLALIR